ncbi:MAG: three-Cys-motif partner protein TcmP [Dehalococcoidales bacterium]
MKLDAIEKYLNFYTTALKRQHFKLCYIDAFAGSGSIKIKSGDEIRGSAIRALKYPFDKFIFFEEDRSIIEKLQSNINETGKDKNVEFYNADCNTFLLEIDNINWMKDNWRGVIFLDPYAMDLRWDCLNKVSATKVLDVWYLFPFMALNRNFYRNGKIPKANKEKISLILGIDESEWESKIYSNSPQLSFLEDNIKQKASIDGIKNLVINRLKQTFPTVSEKAVILRNKTKSPQFLLCFAASNPSKAAGNLSKKVADDILSKMSDDNGL